MHETCKPDLEPTNATNSSVFGFDYDGKGWGWRDIEKNALKNQTRDRSKIKRERVSERETRADHKEAFPYKGKAHYHATS